MEIGILDKSFICVIQPVIKALFGNADMTADSDAVEYTLFYQIICCGTTDTQNVLNLIKDYPISYPVVLDVEAQEMNGLTPSQIADIINAFCKKVETAGYYPMVYTNDYWISNKIDMTKVH